ncbi:phage/plasmid primase, P4 family [Mannheimia sp. HC-2023]|uniref:DNA primase family protein n=1 Tax=Mannheimia indoligenes TaxID=3103145 RepID=UPI002FE6106C
MTKFKNAPNVNKQPKGKPYEAYIIAGSNAWDKTKQQTVLEWTKAEPNYQPIILGSKELREIDRLKLAVEVGNVAIYRAGTLTEAEKSAICQNLAKYSAAETVVFYDEALQLEENASGYIARLRTENGGSVAEKPKIKESDRTNDKARAFQKWLGLDLAFQCGSREIHAYNGKIWEKVEREQINRNVVTFLEENEIGYSKKSVNALLETMEIQLPLMGEVAGDLIAFDNGVLNRNTLLFEPHNRQNWLTAYIPHSYDENVAETPHFDQWLNFVSDGKQDKAKNILAALYAILTNRYNWQVFFQVTGKGGSGKSVFAGIATLLAGEKNTASARLENFDDERKIAGLEDKKLIICSEQTKYAGDGGGLKAITGGDMMRVDPKNKHPFNARIAAMIMIVNNDPCKWTERNGGIDRRIVNFRFNKRPPENERDPYFMDKITLEIGGIIRKVLDTFPDPLEAKRALEEQKESLEALEIKKQSDPLTDFFEYLYTTENTDGLYIGTGNTLGHDKIRTHLYPAYLAFVKAKNVLELGLNTFVVGIEQAVKQHGNKHDFTKRKTNKGQRTNVHFKNFDDFQSDILN